jgi:hypothetical protein
MWFSYKNWDHERSPRITHCVTPLPNNFNLKRNPLHIQPDVVTWLSFLYCHSLVLSVSCTPHSCNPISYCLFHVHHAPVTLFLTIHSMYTMLLQPYLLPSVPCTPFSCNPISYCPFHVHHALVTLSPTVRFMYNMLL